MVQMQRGELMETKGGRGGFSQVRVSTGSWTLTRVPGCLEEERVCSVWSVMRDRLTQTKREQKEKGYRSLHQYFLCVAFLKIAQCPTQQRHRAWIQNSLRWSKSFSQPEIRCIWTVVGFRMHTSLQLYIQQNELSRQRRSLFDYWQKPIVFLTRMSSLASVTPKNAFVHSLLCCYCASPRHSTWPPSQCQER